MLKNILNKFKKTSIITSDEVCHCYDVSRKDIYDALNNGCRTLRKFKSITKAGTACGRCNPSLKYHFHKAKKNTSR